MHKEIAWEKIQNSQILKDLLLQNNIYSTLKLKFYLESVVVIINELQVFKTLDHAGVSGPVGQSVPRVAPGDGAQAFVESRGGRLELHVLTTDPQTVEGREVEKQKVYCLLTSSRRTCRRSLKDRHSPEPVTPPATARHSHIHQSGLKLNIPTLLPHY